MALTTIIKDSFNRLLGAFNLKLETLTKEKQIRNHVLELSRNHHFDQPVFSLLPCFENDNFRPIVENLALYQDRIEALHLASTNQVGFTLNNEYYTTPDAEVLYTIIRTFQPERFVEVGSGNSTKICRQAILDGKLNTKIVSIDPCPRTEIDRLADEVHRVRVETLKDTTLFDLKAGDILFVDSSHDISVGNDVIFLLLKIMPQLPPGVLVHIHDIFLPYDYPEDWVVGEGRRWSEQYLLQALLEGNQSWELIWAGHFLQQTQTGFRQWFPEVGNHKAQSLWLRRI